MDFKELLDAFAHDVGMVDPVAYEDENLCHLDINGRDFGFLYATESERMVIWTAIAGLRKKLSGFAVQGADVMGIDLLKAEAVRIATAA